MKTAVLLIEVSHIPSFTIEQCKTVIEKMKTSCSSCKIALLCDENAGRNTAEKVADMKKMGIIDGFFYSSVSGNYLAAALESM